MPERHYIATPRKAHNTNLPTCYELAATIGGRVYVLGYSARKTDAALRTIFHRAMSQLETLAPGSQDIPFAKARGGYAHGADKVAWSGRTERVAACDVHGGYERFTCGGAGIEMRGTVTA